MGAEAARLCRIRIQKRIFGTVYNENFFPMHPDDGGARRPFYIKIFLFIVSSDLGYYFNVEEDYPSIFAEFPNPKFTKNDSELPA